MDIQDVSDTAQYRQILVMQMQRFRSASRRKGERPVNKPTKEQMILRHMAGRENSLRPERQHQENQEHVAVAVHSSFIAAIYPPSVAPLNTLRKINFNDLQLETHHRGSYILFRTVTPPLKMTAIMSIVEDEGGRHEPLQVYQQDDYRDYNEIVPTSQVFIIKEPYYKIMADGNFGIRIDHITDLIQLDDFDFRFPHNWHARVYEVKSAEDWKVEGNQYVKASKFYEADKHYDQALKHATTDEDIRLIRLNRSHVSLALRCYDSALEYAQSVLVNHPEDQKGLFRAARALYELRRFAECFNYLENLVNHHPTNDTAKKDLLRVKQRLKEEECGIFPFNEMLKETFTTPYMDRATFVGPVEVRQTETRGRGLFITKDIKAGDLLICEKAFYTSFAETGLKTSGSKISMTFNINTNRITMGTQADLLTGIVHHLRRNLSLAPAFVELHKGSYVPKGEMIVDGRPIIDTFLVERIISLNCFGHPLRSCDEHTKRRIHTERSKGSDKAASEHYSSTGIWILASYINHSCFGNSHRSFIGDMQIIRAARNLTKDEELTFSYTSPSKALSERQKRNLQGWGFECACSLCVGEKNTPQKLNKKRRTLLEDLQAIFPKTLSGPDDPLVSKIERLVDAIDKTYKHPPAEQPRLALADPLLGLTHIYFTMMRPKDVLGTAKRLLTALGFELQVTATKFTVLRWGFMNACVVEALVYMWNVWGVLDLPLCADAEEAAKTAHEIMVGERDSFEESYGDFRCSGLDGLGEVMMGLALD